MDGNIWLIFATSLLVGYSGALMPGPLLTVTVSESARRGFRMGPLLVAGHGVAEVLLLVALALGLSRLLDLGVVRGAIALLGGLVLLWMGYGIIRAVWRREVSISGKLVGSSAPAVAANRHLLTGALVSVSNPYWIIWWATVGASYVAWSLASGPLGLISFYAGHILSDLTWYSLIAGVVAGGGRLLNDTAYRTVLGVCGTFLLALGLYFLVSGAGWLS